MALSLFLLRHGNTFEAGETPVQVGAQTDIPLTSRGRAQARDVAAFFKQREEIPTHIYSGSLKRQVETAQIIADELSCEERCSHGQAALDEIDYGLWEGLTAESIQEESPEAYRDWTEAAIWPENIFKGTLAEHLNSVKAFLNHLLDTHAPESNILLVSSNGVLRFFRAFEPDIWNAICAQRRVEECKVKTGNYCTAILNAGPEIKVDRWNVRPEV